MIEKLIRQHAQDLRVAEGINAEAILWAIYRCEKYTATNQEPRFEPAYAPGGHYYNHSTPVQELYTKWGNWAACSYSNFQILFVTAVELGYPGPPLGLDRDEVALPYVVKLLNVRIFDRPGNETVEQVADAYNSGNFKDTNVPEAYIRKFVEAYNKALPTCTTSNEPV